MAMGKIDRFTREPPYITHPVGIFLSVSNPLVLMGNHETSGINNDTIDHYASGSGIIGSVCPGQAELSTMH